MDYIHLSISNAVWTSINDFLAASLIDKLNKILGAILSVLSESNGFSFFENFSCAALIQPYFSTPVPSWAEWAREGTSWGEGKAQQGALAHGGAAHSRLGSEQSHSWDTSSLCDPSSRARKSLVCAWNPEGRWLRFSIPGLSLDPGWLKGTNLKWPGWAFWVHLAWFSMSLTQEVQSPEHCDESSPPADLHWFCHKVAKNNRSDGGNTTPWRQFSSIGQEASCSCLSNSTPKKLRLRKLPAMKAKNFVKRQPLGC